MRRPRIRRMARGVRLHQVLAFECDAPTHNATGRGEQADDREAGGCLTAPGLTDQAEGLAIVQSEAHTDPRP